MNDTRLKAAVGYVPYFGQPFFRRSAATQQGLEGHRPALPRDFRRCGHRRRRGDNGARHDAASPVRGSSSCSTASGTVSTSPSSDDIFTWSLTFLGAYVDDDPLARATSARMTKVAGGGDDVLLLDRCAAASAGHGRASGPIEYYNASLDHYFMTADAERSGDARCRHRDSGLAAHRLRVQGLSAGQRTRNGGMPVLRQAGRRVRTRTSSRSSPTNAQDVKNNPLWIFEGLVFRAEMPDAIGACAAESHPGDPHVQQRQGRAGEPPLPDEPQRNRRHAADRAGSSKGRCSAHCREQVSARGCAPVRSAASDEWRARRQQINA